MEKHGNLNKAGGLLAKGYSCFCKGEFFVAAVLFVLIVVLSFVSALTRKLGFPIQWTMDVTQLSFAWLAMLSGDIALRNGALPGVDMLVRKFPKKMQIALSVLCKIFMIALLSFFVYYGFVLVFSNLSRSFQSLPIGYAWVTASLPVCSIFMLVSTATSFKKNVKEWRMA